MGIKTDVAIVAGGAAIGALTLTGVGAVIGVTAAGPVAGGVFAAL